MPKLPEPPGPAALAAIGPDLRVLPAGTVVWRLYFAAGAHPTSWSQLRTWGPTDARFDHHPPPPTNHAHRAILYGAVGPVAAVTCLAEVFQATRVVERVRRAPTWVAFETTQPVPLLDLTGAWPTRAGASMALNSGPRARARRWSQAIYDAFPGVGGLLYSSSMHGNAPCVALYERAIGAVPSAPVFHRALADPAMLSRVKGACRAVGYALV